VRIPQSSALGWRALMTQMNSAACGIMRLNTSPAAQPAAAAAADNNDDA